MVPFPTVLMGLLLIASPGEEPSSRAADQAALKPFAGLVGEWKGTGQVRRGSAKGAWIESADWAWRLTKDSAALEMTSPKGRYVRNAILRPTRDPKRFTLDATLADGKTAHYAGTLGPRDVLAMEADAPPADGPSRITLTPLHDTRLLMLLEAPEPAGRLGEIGFTRQGVAFAAGDSAPACIVTGGRGTTTVSYKGKTYYVCCSGCRDLFQDDPEGVLAEAEAKKASK